MLDAVLSASSLPAAGERSSTSPAEAGSTTFLLLLNAAAGGEAGAQFGAADGGTRGGEPLPLDGNDLPQAPTGPPVAAALAEELAPAVMDPESLPAVPPPTQSVALAAAADDAVAGGSTLAAQMPPLEPPRVTGRGTGDAALVAGAPAVAAIDDAAITAVTPLNEATDDGAAVDAVPTAAIDMPGAVPDALRFAVQPGALQPEPQPLADTQAIASASGTGIAERALRPAADARALEMAPLPSDPEVVSPGESPGKPVPAVGLAQLAASAPVDGEVVLPQGSAAIAGLAPASATNAAPNAAPLPAVLTGTVLAESADGLADALSERVQLQMLRGSNQAVLHLRPAELGRLSVTISTVGDQATVVFVAESAAARDLIEQSLPRLREQLAEAGLQLAHSDVSEQGQRKPGAMPERDAGGRFADAAAATVADTQTVVSLSLLGGATVDIFA
jgi:flagellar hook-length control protein FliK